jgi:hypothetical protein
MVVGCGPACGGAGCAFAAGAGEGTWGVVAGGAVCAWSGIGADIWTEAGCDVGCESAGCCATALTDSRVTIQIKVRMTLISMFLQYANWKTTCTIAVESTG